MNSLAPKGKIIGIRSGQRYFGHLCLPRYYIGLRRIGIRYPRVPLLLQVAQPLCGGSAIVLLGSAGLMKKRQLKNELKSIGPGLEVAFVNMVNKV